MVTFVATLAGLLLALGVISPFGGDAPIASAAAKTVDMGTSRVALKMSGTDSASEPEQLLFTAEGAADYRLDRGRFTYDFSPLAATAPGVPTKAEAVISGLVGYFRFPDVGDGVWHRVDLMDLYKEQFGDAAPLAVSSGNPAQTLKLLEAGGDFDEMGTETLLDGSQTKHFKGVYDLREAAEAAPDEEREALQAGLESAIDQGLPTQYPVDVWVSDDGLVRMLELAFSDGEQSAEVHVELFDFGTEVAAEPPSSNVVDEGGDLT